MTALLEMKQRLRVFYSRYDVYLKPALKFLLAFLAFLMINANIGFMEKAANPAVVLLLALLCALLPVNMTAVFGAALLCLHAFALSLEVFAVTAGLLVIMYALYFRVAPGYGYVLVLTPLMFAFKLPYVLPLVLGLVGGPLCAVPLGCGTVLYYLMSYMKNNEKVLANPESEELSSRLLSLVENVLNNKSMILTILVFAVTLTLVYVIRRMSVDYAWYLAIGTGAVVNIVLFLVGALMMKTDVSIAGLLFGTLAAIAAALVTDFFVFSVDYSRTEYTQFEDDEYYYYVKAVPKLSIAMPNKKVKKINARNRTGRKRR